VILTVRADFTGHLLADPRLGERADRGWLSVLPMSIPNMRRSRRGGFLRFDGATPSNHASASPAMPCQRRKTRPHPPRRRSNSKYAP
jgi:hypothetical protein